MPTPPCSPAVHAHPTQRAVAFGHAASPLPHAPARPVRRAPVRAPTIFPDGLQQFEQAAMAEVLQPRHDLIVPSVAQRLWKRSRPVRVGVANAAGALALGVGAPARAPGVLGALGGWPAALCMGALCAGVAFGAAWGASHRHADAHASGPGRRLALAWPGLSIGLCLAFSGALGAAASAPVTACALLAFLPALRCGGRWLDGAHSPEPHEALGTAVASCIGVSLCFAKGARLASEVALAQAAVCGVCATVVSVLLAMALSVGSRHLPTWFAESLRVRPSALARYCFAPLLARPGEDNTPLPQTIFQVPAGTVDFVRECQARLPPAGEPFAGFDGLPVLHLHGPPGGGKTMGSRGIAQALGAEYVYVSQEDLTTDEIEGLPIGAINALCAVLQSDQLGRRLQKPVVLMIDEINHILPPLQAPYSQQKFYQAVGFVQLSQALHLLSRTRSHVVLVTATNFLQPIAPFLRLLSTRPPVFVDLPRQQSQRDIVRAGVVHIERALGRTTPWPIAVDDETLDALIHAIYARGGISGRSLGKLLEWGQARLHQAQTNKEPAAATAKGRGQILLDAMQVAMRLMPRPTARQAPARASMAPPSAPAASLPKQRASRRAAHAPSTAAERAREADEVLRQCHLRDFPAGQVLEAFVRSVTAAYLDPSKNLALARIKARLGVTMALYSQLYARVLWGQPPAHPFADVAEAAPLHVLAPGARGFWGPMAGALRASVTLNARAAWRGTQALLRAMGIELQPPGGAWAQQAVGAAKAARRHLPSNPLGPASD